MASEFFRVELWRQPFIYCAPTRDNSLHSKMACKCFRLSEFENCPLDFFPTRSGDGTFLRDDRHPGTRRRFRDSKYARAHRVQSEGPFFPRFRDAPFRPLQAPQPRSSMSAACRDWKPDPFLYDRIQHENGSRTTDPCPEVSMSRQRLLFGTTIFLASFLLFLVEPIAARQLLPVLGGSAAVWITCLVFFQTALLVGYAGARQIARYSQQSRYIFPLIFSCIFAIGWAAWPSLPWHESNHPIYTVFHFLGIWIGLPFVMLSATSPLLQVWWARLENSEIPYRLYALSNLASLLALAAYPSLIEPHLTLHVQRLAWCAGFIVFAVLASILAGKIPTPSPSPATSSADNLSGAPAPLSHKLLWFLLPLGAAMQLSAITAYLTANVAAIPLLWILPLGVYLITIILAFQFRVLLPWGIIARFMVVMLAGLAYSLSKTNTSWPLWLSITFFLIEL